MAEISAPNERLNVQIPSKQKYNLFSSGCKISMNSNSHGINSFCVLRVPFHLAAVERK